MPKPPPIAPRLRRVQDALGLTVKAMSEKVGIAFSTYTDALYGYHEPKGLVRRAFMSVIETEEKRLCLPPMEGGK
jgi:transcriptional regulator with XRE-family HTH domain